MIIKEQNISRIVPVMPDLFMEASYLACKSEAAKMLAALGISIKCDQIILHR
jgi:hypothetical protein